MYVARVSSLLLTVCVLYEGHAINYDYDDAIILDQRIFGGSDATIGQFPYVASLRVFAKNRWRHVCGGSIITERWILTAAHCLRRRNESDLAIYVNTITTIDSDGDVYRPERLIVHPNFTANPVRHDVGLIKLTRNITFEHRFGVGGARAIRISRDRYDAAGGTSVIVCGWGFYRTNAIAGASETLQYARQRTLDDAECRERFNATSNLYDGNLCAYDALGVGACHGDSGGPLVKRRNDAANGGDGDLLIGIASWVKYPCASGNPDVYVRAADYLAWISLTVYSN